MPYTYHLEDDLIHVTQVLKEDRLFVELKNLKNKKPSWLTKWRAYRRALRFFPGFKKSKTHWDCNPPSFEMIPRKLTF